MSYKALSLFAAAAVIVSCALPQAAFADWNRGNGRGYDRHDDRDDRHDNGRRNNWRIREVPRHYEAPRFVVVPQRPVYYYYPQQAYGYETLSPQYYVGQRLVSYQAVPQPVLYRLSPCPRGYYYSYHNNNVFMVRQQDNVIEQIISLLAR